MLHVMRRVRRLTAVVTQLLMIHLAIVSGAMACPMGDDGSPGAVSTASAHGPSHTAAHHPAPQHSHRHHGLHCEFFCTTAGCTSAGHCTAVAAADGDASAAPSLYAVARPTRERIDAPLSVSTAPEPPPPRA